MTFISENDIALLIAATGADRRYATVPRAVVALYLLLVGIIGLRNPPRIFSSSCFTIRSLVIDARNMWLEDIRADHPIGCTITNTALNSFSCFRRVYLWVSDQRF